MRRELGPSNNHTGSEEYLTDSSLVRSSLRSNKTVEAASKRVLSTEITRRAFSDAKRQFAYLHNDQYHTRVTTPYPQSRHRVRSTLRSAPSGSQTKRKAIGDDIHDKLGKGYTIRPLFHDECMFAYANDHDRRLVVVVEHKAQTHGCGSDCTSLDGELNQPSDQGVGLCKGQFFLASEKLDRTFEHAMTHEICLHSPVGSSQW